MGVRAVSGIVVVTLVVVVLFRYAGSGKRAAAPEPAKVPAVEHEASDNRDGSMNDVQPAASVADQPPARPTDKPAAPPVAAPPTPKTVDKPVTVETPTDAGKQALDLTTPKATVTSFSRVVGMGDWAKAVDCFLPGGVDFDDVREIADAREGSRAYKIKRILEAIDPDEPAEVTSVQEQADGRVKVVWKVTLKEGVEVDGRAIAAGETMEYDATLAKTNDGRWLIDNF